MNDMTPSDSMNESRVELSQVRDSKVSRDVGGASLAQSMTLNKSQTDVSKDDKNLLELASKES